MRWLLALLIAFFALTTEASAQSKTNAKDEAALLKNAEAFLEAFHAGNAKRLAAFWAPDGDYTDQTGRNLKGREAIEKAFTHFFAEHKGAKLRIDIGALRFPTPDVAVEDGTTAVMPADGAPPSRARYTIVHVKKDGSWHLSSVRDAPYAPATNHEFLSSLDWLVGDWADDGKGETARASYVWSDSQNFLIGALTTTVKDIAIGGATQWIGWDPSVKQMRSWTFDNNGGFSSGTWTSDAKSWTIKTSGITHDGKKVSATNIITRVDADTLGWQARDRMIDGQALSDIAEVRLKRSK